MVSILLLSTLACRRDTCETCRDFAVGIGAREYIEVPYGAVVTPTTDERGTHFDLAVRMRGYANGGAQLTFTAAVGPLLVAQATHEDVVFEKRGRFLEAGNLRLDLDPSTLPSAAPLEPPPPPRVETGDTVDTGHRVQPQNVPDLQILANLLTSDGITIREEVWWTVER